MKAHCEESRITISVYVVLLPVLLLSVITPIAVGSPFQRSESDNGDEEPTPVVRVGEGDKAVLTCTVSRPINDSIDLILWFRGESETALYSLDARSGPIQRAKHFPSDDLSSRAYIDITGR